MGRNGNCRWRCGVGHGWEGVVLKLFRGKDFVFTVTGPNRSLGATAGCP